MNNNEQNDLSYQRIQQLIKKQLDRIEHETGEKTNSRHKNPRRDSPPKAYCKHCGYHQKASKNEMSAFM